MCSSKEFLFSVLIIFSLARLLSANTVKEEQATGNPVVAQAEMDSGTVTPGGTAQVTIHMTVSPGFHAYKDLFKVKWDGNEAVTFDALKIEPLHTFEDPFSKRTREVVEVKGVATTIAHFPNDLKVGTHQEKINFTYQACDHDHCYFPVTLNLNLSFDVLPGATNQATSTQPSTSAVDNTLGGSFQKALAKGKIVAFLFVFIAGFLTSLTPCIFPMIPITISIIGARAAQNQKSRAFILSLSYVFGIAITYSILGVVAATTGTLFGSALSNIWVISFVSLVFLAMGLSMLGLYELQVPAGIRNKFGNASTGTGVPGAFLGGLFAGIVASPCIGPVLVAVLTYVAKTAEAIFGFFLMFTFAMGMGVLFIVLGTFSGLLTKLPKAGGWMETVKFSFGIIFIAMAYFYLYPHMSQKVFNLSIGAGVIFITSYFGAFAPAQATTEGQLKKGVMLAGFVAACALVGSTIFSHFVDSKKILVPSASASGVTKGKSKPPTLPWQPYNEDIIASLHQNHKPAIVDFYAEWCFACHELEKYTYNDPNVVAKGMDFDLLQIDATNSTPEVDALLKKYGVTGLPTVVFIDSAGKVHDDLTIVGFVKGDEFLSHMKRDL